MGSQNRKPAFNFLPTSQTVQSPKWTHLATTPARPILCPIVKWDVSDITIGKEELLFLTIQTAPTAVSQTNGTAARLKDDEILAQCILANDISLV